MSRLNSALRIVHVTAPAGFGGLEGVVQQLAVGQQRHGHVVHVIATIAGAGNLRTDYHHPFLSSLREETVPTSILILPPRAYLRARRAAAGLFRRLQPDVVHTHGYRSDVVEGVTALKLGLPTISTVHGFTGGGLKKRSYERLQIYALRRFGAVVAVSCSLANRLTASGVTSDRVTVIRNCYYPRVTLMTGPTARSELGLRPDQLHIGWVGRLSREKGFDLLLEALPSLAELPLTVSVLGDGKDRVYLEKRAAALGIWDRIIWHGVVSNAVRLFRAFDVIVSSSRTEGTPLTLLEAMAAGVPIVATRVGGIPDILGPLEALLVPPENTSELAAAIRLTFANRSQTQSRVAAARERLAREFAFEPWLTRYDAAYERILV